MRIMSMFRTAPETAADISAICELLKALSFDETATYDRISAAIGRDVRGTSRWVLVKAIRQAETETGSLFASVHRVGIKRLRAADAHNVGRSSMRRIRRAAGRTHQRLGYVRGNDVTGQDRAKIEAYRSVFGAISALSREGVAQQVEQAAAPQSVLPVGRVLEIFRARS